MSAVDLSQDERLAYRFLAAVDIEGFSKLDVLGQRRAQAALDQVLKAAASASGLDRRRWAVQVSGDGELAVLPPDTNGLRLVADYPREFARAVVAVNRARRSLPRLRIRLALHHGTIAPGQFGPVGQAPIVISRLLDSDALRRRLADNRDLDLAVVVSASLYHDVIQTRFRGLDPRDFAPVDFDAKGTSYVGYIYKGSWPARRRVRLRR
jgi:class 3 adenylate cyclase